MSVMLLQRILLLTHNGGMLALILGQKVSWPCVQVY